MYAESSEQVIAARAVMGLGAALVMPSTLSIIVTIFPMDERPKAIGIWAATAGIGAPIGLFVGGVIVQNYDWSMVFWVNVPIAILAIITSAIIVPESKDNNQTKLDLVGSLLSIAALGTFLYTIIEAPNMGWFSAKTLGLTILAGVLLYTFSKWEKKIEHPMLPMSFFKEPGFITGLIAVSLAFFVMFTFLFTQMLHFQLVRGHDALIAAMHLLPLPFALLPAASNSDKLVEKFGRRKVVSTGLLMLTTGMLLFATQVTIDSDYTVIAIVFLILGVGMGLTMAPSTSLIMQGIPTDKVGIGSATNDASREIGGAMGIAIGGSLLNEFYQAKFKLPDDIDPSTLSADPNVSFPAAIRIGEELRDSGIPAGQELIDIGREAFMYGMTSSAAGSAVISLVAAVIVMVWMPDSKVQLEKEL